MTDALPVRRSRPWSVLAAGLVTLLALPPSLGARAERLELEHRALHLPGAPAAIESADVDGDGRVDLAVVVAYTEWDQIEISEMSTMDRVRGLVEVMTIVPALERRRELRVWLAGPEGGYRPAGAPLELGHDVLSLIPGPGRSSLLALTDRGVSRVVLEDGILDLVAAVEEPPVLAGSGVFLPDLGPDRDVTGDGVEDLLFPGAEGLVVFPGGPDGYGPVAASRIPLGGDETSISDGRVERTFPLPVARDVSGDGIADLVWADPEEGWSTSRVAVSRGAGSFEPAVTVEGDDRTVFLGDVDGDGAGELVSHVLSEEPDDAGMREGIRHAESPPGELRIHRLSLVDGPSEEPISTVETVGYAFDGDSDIALPGGFVDLDGDGRLDLVTLTLQISVTRVLGSLVTKRLTLPMDFHVWCQDEDGRFRPVRDLDLAGEFKVDLDELRLRGLPMFAGDFDGDGRIDFVQAGRGRKLTIHPGEPGCRFPKRPGLALRLENELLHVDLLRIADFDGDGRADVAVVVPEEPDEAGETAPVVVDLYLSGGGG